MKMMKRRIGVPLVLGSLVALFVMADVATASHTVPIGASPFRVPLVPSFAPCETASANSTHGAPLSFPSCNPPALTSSTVKVGPNALGFARIVVCPAGNVSTFCNPTPAGTMPKPDVRLTGSGRDIQCIQTGTPPGCTANGDYNPQGGTGPYTDTGNGTGGATPFCNPDATSATDCIAATDVTATAELATSAASIGGTGNFAGHAIRVSDHYNCNLTGPPVCPATPSSNYPATMTDLQFPVPVDCIVTVSTTQGSTCGVNTTANALVPGAVIANQQAVVEIGEVILKDSGSDGVRGNANDQIFAAQGIFLP
jgi:hypothetical protein